MNNYNLKNKDLFGDIPEELKKYFNGEDFAWEVLPKIKDIVKELLETGLNGFTLKEEGVLIGKNVKIAKTVTIEAPAIIGNNVEIRPGAYIRGNVIVWDNSVIGNSTELKNCILFNNVQVPHYNYVGDSVLGSFSHMGAGSVCSNLKSDKKNVVVHADKDYQTGLRKFGAILGDNADIGCGSVLNPGTVIGKNTRVYPLTSTRGAYPENSIVKDAKTVVDMK